MGYCSSAWYKPSFGRSHHKTQTVKLQRVQNQAARVISGAYRATSTMALGIETYLLPLDLELEYRAITSCLRLAYGHLSKIILQWRSKNESRSKGPMEEFLEYSVREMPASHASLEMRQPYIAPPLWASLEIAIPEDKTAALKMHSLILINQELN